MTYPHSNLYSNKIYQYCNFTDNILKISAELPKCIYLPIIFTKKLCSET